MMRIDLWSLNADDDSFGFGKLGYERKTIGYINDDDESRLDKEAKGQDYVDPSMYAGQEDWTAIMMEQALRDYSRDHVRAWYNSKRGRFITLTPIRPINDDDGEWSDFRVSV